MTLFTTRQLTYLKGRFTLTLDGTCTIQQRGTAASGLEQQGFANVLTAVPCRVLTPTVNRLITPYETTGEQQFAGATKGKRMITVPYGTPVTRGALIIVAKRPANTGNVYYSVVDVSSDETDQLSVTADCEFVKETFS